MREYILIRRGNIEENMEVCKARDARRRRPSLRYPSGIVDMDDRSSECGSLVFSSRGIRSQFSFILDHFSILHLPIF